MIKHICPVCGYPNLDEPSYDKTGYPSYNICDCCGFEFGFDDTNNGIAFDNYRKKWIKEGASWFSEHKKPPHWNLEEQLKNLKKQK